MAKTPPIEIVFEDDHIVAANKPAGLLTIPDRFNHDLPNLYAILAIERENLHTVHRLDRYTSGGIIFAKNQEVHRSISQSFMDRIPEKYYIAVCDGIFKNTEGEVNEPLTESMTTRGKMLIHPRGKESRTTYEVIESYHRFSLVKLRIHTGRMHQIRVHMAHIGHPLAVDSLYGKRSELFLSEIKGKKFRLGKDIEEQPLISRQSLHSSQLVLPHPITGNSLDLQFEPPKDMRALINQLKKT